MRILDCVIMSSLWGNLIRQVAIDESGVGGGLKDFLEYTEMESGGAATAEIQWLKGLMNRQPIDHKRGPIDDKTFETVSIRESENARYAN